MSDHDLSIERTFDAPLDMVWSAITGHIAEWWCPKPWTTEVAALDWRSGGRFALTMRGPEGETHPVDGVLLEVTPRQRVVFTNMLTGSWAPASPQPVGIVGMFDLSDAGNGKTHYRATARHWSEADRIAHADMGFADGWGICADQLEAVAKRLADA